MDMSLLVLFGMGKTIDPVVLKHMVESMNARRRKIFMKVADLLFGLVMFFWGDLTITVTDSTGKSVDATSPNVPIEDKLNAMLAAMKSTQKSTLFRELVRPFIIDAAEVLASLMEPDPMLLGLISGQMSPLGPMASSAAPQLPAAPSTPTPVGAPVAPPINTGIRVGTAGNPVVSRTGGL